MAVSPSVQNSTSSSSGDPLSPTTIILNRLRSQGVPITPENIRRAVTEMGRASNQAGPDVSPDLRVGLVEDSGPSVGQRGNVAKRVEGGGRTPAGRGRGLPIPPVPPGGATQPMDRRDTGGSGGDQPRTSAPPSSSGIDLTDLIGPLAAGGAALGGAKLFDYLDSRGRGGGQTFMGNSPMDPTGRVIDVPLPGISGPPGIGGANSALPTPDIRALPQPTPSLAGPAGAPPPATDMEAAMQRAIAPPMTPDAPMLGGSVRPYTPDPGAVIGAGQSLPPGVTDADAARAAIGPGGMTQDRVAGQVGVPEVPFASNPATRGAPMEVPNRAGLLSSIIESLVGAARGVARH